MLYASHYFMHNSVPIFIFSYWLPADGDDIIMPPAIIVFFRLDVIIT